MNQWLYRGYGLLFRLFRLFGMKPDKAFFFMGHDCKFQGNIRYVHDAMKKEYPGIRRVVISKKQLFAPRGNSAFAQGLQKLIGSLGLFVVVNYHMATSHYIFLNDNFLPLAYMPFSPDAVLVQLWHGAGAFKRFGLDTEPDPDVRRMVKKGNRRVNYVPVTAKHIVPIYESALGIPRKNIHPDGIPLMDYYFDGQRQQRAAERFYRSYPACRGKKLILYTPTFRTEPEENDAIWEQLRAEELLRRLGEEYVLLVRFHPQRPPKGIERLPQNCVNVTDYGDVKGLYTVSELMITDYSCTAVEYSLLGKPLLFFAYDLERYDRGCYLDYEALPGGVLRTAQELPDAILHPEAGLQNAAYFAKQHFDCLMEYGYSRRLLQKLMKRA